MPRHLLAALAALMLTACGGSTRSMPRFELPPPPQAALGPCSPTPAHRQPDGSATAADAEATIRDGRFDLAQCDAKRRALVDAWAR